jgi:hypothetical protein
LVGRNIGFNDGIDKIYDDYDQVCNKNIRLMEITHDDIYKIVEFVKVDYKIEEMEFKS